MQKLLSKLIIRMKGKVNCILIIGNGYRIAIAVPYHKHSKTHSVQLAEQRLTQGICFCPIRCALRLRLLRHDDCRLTVVLGRWGVLLQRILHKNQAGQAQQ